MTMRDFWIGLNSVTRNRDDGGGAQSFDDVSDDDNDEEDAGDDDLGGENETEDDILDFLDKSGTEDATVKAEGGQKKGAQDKQDQAGARKGQQRPQPGDRKGGTSNSPAQFLQRYARTRLPEDKAGNLVDPQTGAVIARAGAERHYFEAARNTSFQLQRLVGRAQEVERLGRQFEAKVQAYEQANKIANDYGITPADQVKAVQFMAAYKKNPAAAIKYMLTEAAAEGINIGELVGQQSGIDVGAIGRIIDQKLHPLTQRHEAASRVEQANDRAAREVNAFWSAHPDARIHEEALAGMIARDPNLTPEVAYWRLRSYCTERGLDFTQPLRTQLQARMQNGNGNGQRRRPLPSGRAHAAMQDHDSQQQQGSMSATSSTDDIVRQAMRESGMKI